VYNDSWSVNDRRLDLHEEGERDILSTAERRAREKAQRRREILDAARQEFFERGFHRPTMDDVAARAEVSKGTIYLYFESKEEILAHLLLEGLDLLLAQMEAAANSASPAAAESALRILANAYLDFCQSYPSYFRLIMAFDRGRFEELIPPDLYRQVLDQSLRALGLVVQTIEDGKASGEFCVQDPRQAAGSLWAALNGVLVLMAHPLRRRMLESDLETMFQATLDLVIKGLQDGRKTCPVSEDVTDR
jgi:AcrR family transcriptional regulator